jgi:hypothetical protein
LEGYKEYPDIGTYKIDNYYDKEKQTNAVIMDRTLDKHITPIPLFGNCNYGITTVISKYYTTNLISLFYE